MTVRIKNRRTSKVRRLYSTGKNRIDIEDPWWIGNKSSWSWWCPVCEKRGIRSKMLPYRQDKYGDIVVACENPMCIKSGNFDQSINSELTKLLKQLQNNSKKFYIRYNGSYH